MHPAMHGGQAGKAAARAWLQLIENSLCDVVEVLAVPVGVALRVLLPNPQPASGGLLLCGIPQAAAPRALAPEGVVHGMDQRVGLQRRTSTQTWLLNSWGRAELAAA